MSKAIQQLKDEHQGILLMFKILDKICEKFKTQGELNADHLTDILEFFKVFVDKCHHGKEEDLLFPAMEQEGIPRQGPIGVMLAEHEKGRSYVNAMNLALERYRSGDRSTATEIIDNAKGYIALMRSHIDKEDNVLYPMGEQRFSEDRDADLYEGFERIENERIGTGKHEAFHELMHNLKEIYHV